MTPWLSENLTVLLDLPRLGQFPQVSGKAAREEARRLQQIASDGVDLKLYKEGIPATPLFCVSAENLYQRKCQKGLSASATGKLRSMTENCLDHLGDCVPILSTFSASKSEIQL